MQSKVVFTALLWKEYKKGLSIWMDHGHHKNSRFYDFAKKKYNWVYPTFNLKDYKTCVNGKGDTKSKAILFFLLLSFIVRFSCWKFNTKPFSQAIIGVVIQCLQKKSLQKLVQDVEKNLHKFANDDFRTNNIVCEYFQMITIW